MGQSGPWKHLYRGTCSSHQALLRRKPLGERGLLPRTSKCPAVNHTNPQFLRPAMPFHTPRPVLLLRSLPRMLFSFLRTPIYFSRPNGNVTSSWKASLTPPLSSSPLRFHGNLSESYNHSVTRMFLLLDRDPFG